MSAGVALILAALAGVASPPADPATDAFMNRARHDLHQTVRIDQERVMGDTVEMSRRIAEQVIVNGKRATVARLAEFTEQGSAVPRPGQIVLVRRFGGEPSFLYRVAAVQVLPFGKITSWHIADESPALRDLAAFRAGHLKAWAQALSSLSPAEVEATPVVWQRFDLIYPKPLTYGGSRPHGHRRR